MSAPQQKFSTVSASPRVVVDTASVGVSNRRKIVATLSDKGPLTRAELARLTGLSHPTVSKVVDVFCASRILEEAGSVQPMMGRPSVTVGLASGKSRVLSLVVGASRCSLVASGIDVSNSDGQADIFPTPGSYAELLEQVAERLKRSTFQILGLGICLPGLLDAKHESLLVCPNLEWLEGRSLKQDFEKCFGFPTVLVQAMAAHYFFESRLNRRAAMDDFVVVNCYGGLGIAACSNGELVKGASGLAGELGHITVKAEGGELCGCGNRGCLETIASDRAVVQTASEKMGKTLTLTEVIELAQSGNETCEAVLNDAGRYLAIGLAAVVNIFNPRAVFLYCRFIKADEGLFECVVSWARERSFAPSSARCEIFAADRDPHECQQIGAAAAIIDRLIETAPSGRDSNKSIAAER